MVVVIKMQVETQFVLDKALNEISLEFVWYDWYNNIKLSPNCRLKIRVEKDVWACNSERGGSIEQNNESYSDS